MGKLPRQTKRRDLIKRFKELKFSGPHQGSGRHPEYMAKDGRVVKLPNPHRGDIGEGLLKMLLAEAGLSVNKWLGEPDDEEKGSKPDVG